MEATLFMPATWEPTTMLSLGEIQEWNHRSSFVGIGVLYQDRVRSFIVFGCEVKDCASVVFWGINVLSFMVNAG